MTKSKEYKPLKRTLAICKDLDIPFVSPNNSKLGNIPSYSLHPDKTCTNNECYKSGCYFLKLTKIYPSLVKTLDHNHTILNRHGIAYTMYSISDYLHVSNAKYFRWFVGGDIPSQAFYNGMVELAKMHPEVKFLCFTKQYNSIRFGRIPSNLSIVLSAWVNQPLPKTSQKLPIAYYQNGFESRIKNELYCKGNCSKCYYCFNLKKLGKNIVFNRH